MYRKFFAASSAPEVFKLFYEEVTYNILLQHQYCLQWVFIRPVMLLLLRQQFHYFHQGGYYVTKIDLSYIRYGGKQSSNRSVLVSK